MENGIFSKILSWPSEVVSYTHDKTTLKEWIFGLFLILIVAFLWSTAVNIIE